MFELYQLEQLVTIAEQGTISKAAEILHISQPALTRSIQKLEDDLGIKLFSRSKNKMILNETGLLAVELAYKIIEDAKYIVEKLHAFEKSQQSITIGSCAPGPLWELESILKKDYSSAQITSEIVDDEALLKNFEDDIYQIIITTKPINDENIFSQPFCHEELCISLPPAHPLSNYPNVSFEDLNGESFLLYSLIGFWYDLCKEMMPDSLFIVQDKTNT
ncbi:MAG: LysR family transcriptional regulator [Coprobacillaceae bacterium]